MAQQQHSRWPPIRRQLLWAGVIAALTFLAIVVCSYLFGWHWTGLPRLKVPPNTQPTKSLWDWLDLLIVPVVLATGGFLFNSLAPTRQLELGDKQAEAEPRSRYRKRSSLFKNSFALSCAPGSGTEYVVFVVFWTCLPALMDRRPGRQPLFQHAGSIWGCAECPTLATYSCGQKLIGRISGRKPTTVTVGAHLTEHERGGKIDGACCYPLPAERRTRPSRVK
jgi:hypothetical protein